MTAPRVSVVMTVWNAAPYLEEALLSVLGQTFEDFELVVVDDGSTDAGPDLVEGHPDPRIRLLRRAHQGIVAAANAGLAAARGELIARMDADDVSLPDRLERQVAFLDRHPDVVLVGSNYEIINGSGTVLGRSDFFTHPDDLRLAIVTGNQFGNGTTMMRREAIERAGGYRPSAAEDYDLFARLAALAPVANLSQVTYRWRQSPTSFTHQNLALQAAAAAAVRDEQIDRFLTSPSRFRVWRAPSLDRHERERRAVMLCDLACLLIDRGLRWRPLAYRALAMVLSPRSRRTASNRRHLSGPAFAGAWAAQRSLSPSARPTAARSARR